MNERVRYYKLSLILNLFGEYIFECEYGNIKAQKPTRVLKEYFSNYKEAYIALELKLSQKYKRGYKDIKEDKEY
ncbi:MAG: WGR domain-containing protein [Sulfurimonas sp.]|nr:WGR domain-containing protein [Sulfurimonas sp.]